MCWCTVGEWSDGELHLLQPSVHVVGVLSVYPSIVAECGLCACTGMATVVLVSVTGHQKSRAGVCRWFSKGKRAFVAWKTNLCVCCSAPPLFLLVSILLEQLACVCVSTQN